MPVNGVNSNQYGYTAPVANQNAAVVEAEQEAKKKEEEVSQKEDGFVKEANYKPDTQKIYEMKADMNKKMGAFQAMVQSLFQKQGDKAKQADPMQQLLNIDAATQKEAQDAISEDGYWGVEQTANRIIEFAKALSGGDPAKADMLMKAVEDGFKAAEKVWGGELPDISKQTFERVKQGFEEWKNPKTIASED